MQSVLILGRQPALGLAELESLYTHQKVRPAGWKAAIVDVDPCLLAFDRLGGSSKFCKVLSTLETTDWKQIEKFLIQVSPSHSQSMPEGKMTLGLSLYGFRETTERIQATGLSLKKAIRKTGRTVRYVPNKAAELNSAQVIHNGLTGTNGWELVFIKNGSQTIVAQTIKVQDIASYTRRDRERPKRDSRIGMLPPKLAQIIINLAVGTLPEEKLQSICEIPAGSPIPKPLFSKNILDPFCGTGVILQEALLMGYGAYGSDAEQRMVDYSTTNVAEWLHEWYAYETAVGIEKGDATTTRWDFVPTVDTIASETYLGRPFTSIPAQSILEQTSNDCNLIVKKFLKNIYPQLSPGSRLCLAIPAWQIRPGTFRFLPLVDQVSDLGYNRCSFEHVRNEDLLYYREDQIVARQMLVIVRK